MKPPLVHIRLKPDAEPYGLTTARRVPSPIMRNVEGELKRMEKDDIIKAITKPTDWCAVMVPVVKKHGDINICVNFEKLIQSVRRPHLMLPN